MDAKLTLKLNKEVIDKAKAYASARNQSLSRMIESYLKALAVEEVDQSEKDVEISPFVSSMRTGINLPSDFDYKQTIADHLLEKHK